MTEGAPKVTPEGVEAEPRRTGHRALDISLAGAAVLISIVSLVIAIKHGMIMNDLVAANSWPLLQYRTSNFDETRSIESITLGIENAGIGPAIVHRFAARWNGREYIHPETLLQACCGHVPRQQAAAQEGTPLTNNIGDTVIKAGEQRAYLVIDRTSTNADVWRRLDRIRHQLAFEACYCSVLGDCWQSDLTGVRPAAVDRCPALAK